jgi:hypothetical protein
MRLTNRAWHVCAVIYRMLVVAQTVGWAVLSLARIVTRPARATLNASPFGAALAVSSVLGIATGLLTYGLRRSQSRDRDAAVLAWAWFQAAGFLALTGYVVTGTAIHFILGVFTLAVMHAFSPNRFQTQPGV